MPSGVLAHAQRVIELMMSSVFVCDRVPVLRPPQILALGAPLAARLGGCAEIVRRPRRAPDDAIDRVHERRYLVSGDDDGAPRARQVTKGVREDLGVVRRDDAVWLVREQARRRAEQRGGELRATPLTARQFARTLIEPVADPGGRGDVVDRAAADASLHEPELPSGGARARGQVVVR